MSKREFSLEQLSELLGCAVSGVALPVGPGRDASDGRPARLVISVEGDDEPVDWRARALKAEAALREIAEEPWSPSSPSLRPMCPRCDVVSDRRPFPHDDWCPIHRAARALDGTRATPPIDARKQALVEAHGALMTRAEELWTEGDEEKRTKGTFMKHEQASQAEEDAALVANLAEKTP